MLSKSKCIWAMALVICLSSCQVLEDDFAVESIDAQPELALPLLRANVTLQDILDNIDNGGSLEIAPDNSLSINHQLELFSGASEEIISIPDLIIPMDDSVLVASVSDLDLEYDLKRADFKSGKFVYNIVSDALEDISITLRIEDLKKDGMPFTHSFNVPYLGAFPTEYADSLDFSDYSLDLYGDLTVRYIATNAAGTRLKLPAVIQSLRELEYSYIEGNFSDITIDTPQDTVIIGIFEEATNGDFFLDDPKIKLNISSSFGFPMTIQADTLYVNTAKAGALNFVTDLDNPVPLNYPSLSEVGQFKTTTVSVDRTNSNLTEVIGNLPEDVIMRLAGVVSPNDASTIGFALDTSSFNANMEIELPLFGRVLDFTFESKESIDLDFNEDLTEAEFKLVVDNGFPADVYMQLYLEDDAGIILDSLMSTGPTLVVASANVDANGKVNETITEETFISVNQQTLMTLKNAKKIRLVTNMTTLNSGMTSIKLFTDYEMDLKLGVKLIR